MRVSLLVAAAAVLTTCGGDDRTTTTVETPAGTTTTTTTDNGTTTTGTSTAGTMMADEADDAVERAFETDAGLAQFDLDADDRAGGVRLTGTVATDAQRAEAERVAAAAAPGLALDNQIRVAPARLDADEAADRVEDAFEADAALTALDLDADDDGAQIVLRGTATAAQSAAAEALAREQASAFPIVNRITVR